MSSNDGYMQPPYWTTMSGIKENDYTRGREPVSYTMDDIIGRPDYIKTSDPATASGTPGTVLF